ncbi:formin-like protein 8 [Quercus suber]|uniref:Formin-like protein n=1 Tax=Quercus suber TaxID=58331 RepID=A0AAW0LCL5_QUESU
MAVIFLQPFSILVFFSVFFFIPFSHCQYGSPQNIETFFPYDLSPSPQPDFPSNPSSNPPLPTLPTSPAPPPQNSSSTRNKIVRAVAITAAGTLVLSVLLFFLIHRRVAAKREREEDVSANLDHGKQPAAGAGNEVKDFDGNLKGYIVDEDGLDVLYWRKLEGKSSKKSFKKEALHNSRNEQQEEGVEINERRQRKAEPIQEVPLLRGKSSTSQVILVEEVNDSDDDSDQISHSYPRPVVFAIKDDVKPEDLIQISTPPPSPSPPSSPKPLPLDANSLARPPPPPPPPPIPANKNLAAAPPPPPPPLKAGGLKSSSNVPPPPNAKPGNNKSGESSSGTGNGHVKMKPLHWDKVNTNTDHSMVRNSPQRNNNSIDGSSQVVILDPKKSQNIAIVVKSLAISQEEFLDALIEGQGLNADAIEKLARVAPTEEEQSKILEFDGDPRRLAAAESFLYRLLKAVPSSFTRLNAMLFRLNYDSEILNLKESIQTLELGCKELRTRGLFMKLLEAILKAGNRMNAGTTRGNAEAFNLNALRKLSDVKSIDGKTTLLHFVVEEVIRSEGKRCVLNRDRSMGRNMSRSSSHSSTSSNSSNSESLTMEEREKEFKILGLPMVGGLSSEFSNVKKAASIDYDTFAGTISALTAHTAEIKALVSQCGNDRSGGGFVREMKGFLEAAEEELKVLREEQTMVMKLVQKTTEYYQSGASKDKGAPPLQLFVIVKNFLDMVDKACIEIARNLQKKKSATTVGPSSPHSRISVRFPNLPENFMSEKSRGSSSELDDF